MKATAPFLTVLILAAVACTDTGPQGAPGATGLQGPPGPPGPEGPAAALPQDGKIYFPEMYDDCRDAYGSMSATGVRAMLNEYTTDPVERRLYTNMDDSDIRGLIKVACLMLATGIDIPWDDIFTE